MRRVRGVPARLVLSAAMTAAGVALLVAALAVPSRASTAAANGGTLNVDLPSDVDFTDPALAYYVPSWELEYATCLKLLNYPDVNGPGSAQLVPEAAGFPRVSNGGRTYDFDVRAGFTRFSDGSPVGPANFRAELLRVLDPNMQSGGARFYADIVGAKAMMAGTSTTLPGVRVRGSHLIVTLTRPAPDFLARIAMPFACAVPTNLPHDPNGVQTPPSAGPYAITQRVPGASITLTRNPFYHGPRPHRPAEIHYTIGNTLEDTQLRLDQGVTDIGSVPPSAYATLAARFGVNKGRFFVEPALSVWYIAFNHDRPLFGAGGPAGNVSLKKAVNDAIDRHALAVAAGAYAGHRTDQILPPSMPGFRECDCYPTQRPELALARKLARGHTGSGSAVLYTFASAYGPQWAQIVQYDLRQIGLDVQIKQFPRAVEYARAGTRGEPFDMEIDGWSADYPDPSDFLNVLLDGSRLQPSGNTNHAYLDDPAVNAELAAASRLTGARRYAAYGRLDVRIMTTIAPLAPILNPYNRIVVSSRVGCFTYSAVYGNDLAADCLVR